LINGIPASKERNSQTDQNYEEMTSVIKDNFKIHDN